MPWILQIFVPSLAIALMGYGMIEVMTKHWGQIISIWLIVAALAIWAILSQSQSTAPAWFGTILAGSVALVSLYHLFRAQPEGIVRKLVYVGGGSYLILAVATAYVFLAS